MNQMQTVSLDCRFEPIGNEGEISGTAVRFNTVDAYRTTFAPGAFGSLEGRSVPMLWSHDQAQVIGSWSAFDLRQDGLAVRGKLNLAVAKAQEVRALLQSGDVRGLSVGFRIQKDERQANGVRRITQAQLHEISVVALPAVPGSNVTTVRSLPDSHARAMASFAEACRQTARIFNK